jgi:ubiquinone/menaquinone biosynthesis methyltransferase
MDRGWKRQLLERVEARLGPAATILDIACGTGDLAVQLARSDETRRVLGIDASTEMVRVARRQHGARPVVFVTGDVMALPLPTGSISAATAGYAIRNAPTLDGALSELARVIAPGGWIGVLDFYRPSAWWWRAPFLGYLRVAGDLVGWWWHRRPVVYGYIARSIARFTSVDGFGAALERAGFEVVETRRYLLGGIAVHVARRVTRDSSRAPT